MGISLYYSVKRKTPLTVQENEIIEKIITKYSDAFEFKDFGEDFCVYKYDISEPDIIFSGATKLPMTEEVNDMFSACLHWAECLTEIRKSVPNSTWHVNLDDIDLLWDEDTGWYFSDEF